MIINLFYYHLFLRYLICIIMFHKITRFLKGLLKKVDLFGSIQLLRYDSQTNYTTATGGFISLIIIIVFGVILIKDCISVFTKSVVISQDLIYFVDDPTYTTFNFDDSSNFIIGVGINGLDLNAPTRYFDITLSTQIFEYGRFKQEIFHQLQQCQYQQWAHINEIGASSYEKLHLSNFLCPNSSVKADLQGKFTSPRFSLLRMKIGKCNNSTDPSRPCEPQSVVKKSVSYNLNFFFMNAFVNSGTLNPVGYYLEDRDYFGFTLDTTIVSNIYLTEHTIQTDQSLFPWSVTDSQTVLLVNQLAQVKPSVPFPGTYLDIYLRKSPYYILSQRSYVKIIDLFSNIGGLVGFVLTFLLFMQAYTQASFEIEMGDRLFHYDSSQPLKSGNFNFLYFIAFCVYDFLKKIGLEIPWKRMKTYFQCREEVKQQLDISLLMNKVTFLQRCMNILFQEHQFRSIFIQKKPDVNEAGILRKNHGLDLAIHRNGKKLDSKIHQKIKSHMKKMNILNKTDGNNKVGDSKIDPAQSNKQIEIQPAHLLRQQSKQQIPFNLLQLIGNFVIAGSPKLDKPNLQNQFNQEINLISNQVNQDALAKQQTLQLQQVERPSNEQLEFVNTTLNDIRLIEQQSKAGNALSKRIYDQLNNDAIKQRLMILKCLQKIMTRNQPQSLQQTPSKEEKKVEEVKNARQPNFIEQLLKISVKRKQSNEDMKKRIEMQEEGPPTHKNLFNSRER